MVVVENGIVYVVRNGYAIVQGLEKAPAGSSKKQKNIKIPEKIQGNIVIEIDRDAFRDDTILETVELPKTLLKIRHSAFCNCLNLYRVFISQNDTSTIVLEKYAFANCSALTIVSLGCQTIVHSQVFLNCKNLLKINAILTRIETYAFLNCEKLNALQLSDNCLIAINSLANSGIKDLYCRGNLHLMKENEQFIQLNKITIYCSNTSNLVELAYKGCIIQEALFF